MTVSFNIYKIISVKPCICGCNNYIIRTKLHSRKFIDIKRIYEVNGNERIIIDKRVFDISYSSREKDILEIIKWLAKNEKERIEKAFEFVGEPIMLEFLGTIVIFYDIDDFEKFISEVKD